MKLQRDVYIAGVGETVFGKHKLDFDALGRIAALQAMKDANIGKPGVVQSAYMGNAHNGLVTGQTVFKDLGMLATMPINTSQNVSSDVPPSNDTFETFRSNTQGRPTQ